MRLLMLVVPDDHGGVGMDQVGLVAETETVVFGFWLQDPNTQDMLMIEQRREDHAWDTAFTGLTMHGAFPSVRSLADWTGYAVAEMDGTLVYQPEGVFRYARRDPDLWLQG